MDISVVINTFQRPEKALTCLKTILQNDFKSFQIIIIEQSKGEKLKRPIEHFNDRRITYFNFKNLGVSKGKNFGIEKATGEFVAFTDDDCLVDKHWLKQIYTSFTQNQEIAAVFGRVLPYQPEKNRGLICPCTFLKRKEETIVNFCRHWEKIGFGNNMAFRKIFLQKIGGFKDWLGPGSLGLAAEDGEICLRILSQGYKILFNPSVLVYHNRWLNPEGLEWRRQLKHYDCGELAAYGFYAFGGEEIAKEVVREHFKRVFFYIIHRVKRAVVKLSLRQFCETIFDIYYDFRGLIIAFWFAKIRSLPDRHFS